MKTKVKVIKKIKDAVCGCCFRSGEKPSKKCKSCHGTGVYKDYHYVMIVGKVAWDMDTIK